MRRYLLNAAVGAFAAAALLPSAAALAADPGVRENTDLSGSKNLKWFDLPRPWLELCQEACRNIDACRAWTYMKPNVRGPLASCWLKSTVGQPTRNPCCTSGER
jgi:hypothetical protein